MPFSLCSLPLFLLSLYLCVCLCGCRADAMGTEVMHPHDILSSLRLGSSPSTTAAAFFPRRRQISSSFAGSAPNPRPQRRPEPRKRREGSPRPAKNSGGGSDEIREMGQVTILRRGEALDSEAGGGLRAKARKEVETPRSEWATGEPIASGRPVTAAVPRQKRMKEVRTGANTVGWAETYAGSAFLQSPSPRALPLPTFSSRNSAVGAVDVSATMDLRRLLRLE